jgi:hypothetical protein
LELVTWNKEPAGLRSEDERKPQIAQMDAEGKEVPPFKIQN